jgi:hypothetical protein
METLIELKGFTEICGSEKDVLALGGHACSAVNEFVDSYGEQNDKILTTEQLDFIESQSQNYMNNSGPNSSGK